MNSVCRGYLKLVVLMLLNEGESYDIVRDVEEAARDLWKTTPSEMYSILKDLESKGYIKRVEVNEWRRKRNICIITGKGRMVLRFALEKTQQTEEYIRGLSRELSEKILDVDICFALQVFSFPSLLTLLKDKPDGEQRRWLMKIRAGLFSALEIIDKKLSGLEGERYL